MNQQVCYPIKPLLRPPTLESLSLLSYFYQRRWEKLLRRYFETLKISKPDNYSSEFCFQWHFANNFHDFMTIFMSILDSPSNPALNRHLRLITRPLCARRKHSTRQRGKKPCVILFVHKCTAVVIYSLNFAET